MKPPICTICDKRFPHSDEGGVIYFKKRKSDKKWIKEMERKGAVGHPPYAEWFCGEHYETAKELASLTISEAMQILKEKYPNS